MQCRLAVQAALAAHQVSARNLLPTAAAAVLEAVSTTAGLLVATLQELQQGELAEPQPHLSGVRSRNLAPLVGAVRLLALLFLATRLLAQPLGLLPLPACRMYLCLVLVHQEVMRQTTQELRVEPLPGLDPRLGQEPLGERHSFLAAAVEAAAALHSTTMTPQRALLLSAPQPQEETAAAAVVAVAARGAVAVQAALEPSLLETAAALLRIQVEAAAVAAVWCSASFQQALWSQAKQVQAAQARLAPYISGMWANR